MAESSIKVASQIIPIGMGQLVLPNTAIAEITNYTDALPVDDGPECLLGILDWRGRSVPLISFEVAAGDPLPEIVSNQSIAVLNTINGDAKHNFIAIITQGIPHLAQLDKSTVQASDNGGGDNPVILSRVTIDNESCIIPNLDALEKILADFD